MNGLDRLYRRGATVYFLRCGDFIKIGWTRDVTKILRQARRFNPVPVTIIGTCEGCGGLEDELHQAFGQHHIRGEWFEAVDGILEYIAAHTTPWQEQRGPRVQAPA